MTDRPSATPPGSPDEEPQDERQPETPLPERLVHQPQEIPLTDPESRSSFQTTQERPLAVTPAALARFGMETILSCFFRLQYLARLHDGLDYLQVFEDPQTREELWFIEDAPGIVTALLPEDR